MITGIPWFPFDVHLGDSFEFIEADYGLTGFAIVVKLLQKIYGEQGYYCEWTKDVALLFRKKLGIYEKDKKSREHGDNVVSEILRASMERGIFDKNMYDKYHILTSEIIQKRYFEAVSRRKNVEAQKEYLLIELEQKLKNVNILSGNVNIFNENVYRNGTKKTKENYSIVENTTVEDKAVAALQKIIDIYQSNIAPIVPAIADDISFWLERVDADVIEWAIKEAVQHNARNWRYITGILNNHFNAGRTTLAQINNAKGVHKSNPNNLNIYEDNTGFDYDSIEQIMQEKYDKE